MLLAYITEKKCVTFKGKDKIIKTFVFSAISSVTPHL